MRGGLTDGLDGRDILRKMYVPFKVHVHVGKVGRSEGSVGVAAIREKTSPDLAWKHSA